MPQIVNDICIDCGGKGYHAVPVPKGLQTETCSRCGGTGIKPRWTDRHYAAVMLIIAAVFAVLVWRLAL